MVKARQCFTYRRAKRVWVVMGLAWGPVGLAPCIREARAEGASVKVLSHNTDRGGETKQWLPDQ